MPAQNYSVNQPTIQTLLTWRQSTEIVILEIPRPFRLRLSPESLVDSVCLNLRNSKG